MILALLFTATVMAVYHRKSCDGLDSSDDCCSDHFYVWRNTVIPRTLHDHFDVKKYVSTGAEIGHVKIERDKLLRSVTFWCYYSDPVNQFELQYYLTCFDAAQMEMYCISPKYPITRQIELEREDPFEEKRKKYDTRAFCVLKDRSRYPSNLEAFLASVIEMMQVKGSIQKYRDLQELKHDVNDAMKRSKGLFRSRCIDVHQPNFNIDFRFSLSSVTP